MPTGKIVKVAGKPARSFRLRIPAVPPATEPTEIDYAPVDSDDWPIVLACYTNGHDADVSGTAPSCTGVTGL